MKRLRTYALPVLALGAAAALAACSSPATTTAEGGDTSAEQGAGSGAESGDGAAEEAAGGSGSTYELSSEDLATFLTDQGFESAGDAGDLTQQAMEGLADAEIDPAECGDLATALAPTDHTAMAAGANVQSGSGAAAMVFSDAATAQAAIDAQNEMVQTCPEFTATVQGMTTSAQNAGFEASIDGADASTGIEQTMEIDGVPPVTTHTVAVAVGNVVLTTNGLSGDTDAVTSAAQDLTTAFVEAHG
ncbi:hypothetical protein [Brevibacterium litoralis]|uniref:hypothetical protein n=1 Tax=Brevibacterium litoralis TaxID=3138935 RepID=UPI0032F09831